jgi:hypothetical protein
MCIDWANVILIDGDKVCITIRFKSFKNYVFRATDLYRFLKPDLNTKLLIKNMEMIARTNQS